MIRVFSPKLHSAHLIVVFVLAFVCLAVCGIGGLTAAKSLEFGTNARSAASARSDDKGLKPDTTTGIWTMTGSMNQPRADHTATLLPNGKVLAAGGSSSYTGNNFLASAELYDPATSLWSFTGSLNNARRYHTATLLGNGKVLVAGGYDGFTRLKSAELYDPATGTWSPAGSLLNEHANHTATLLQDGRVLVAGGFGSNQIQSSVELYNPALNTWTTVASLNTGRRDHTATLLSDGRVLVTGGYPNANGVLASTEVYNPIANSWSNAASLITGRGNHRATMLGNAKVLVAGGTTGGSFGDLASAELFDSTANTWTAAAPMSSNRITPTATVLQNGRVLMVGGLFDGGSRTGEMYDYTAGSWSDTPDLNFDRRFHTATLLQNGSVLVAGGYDDDLAAYSTSELYHPTGTTNAADPKIVFAKNREGLNHEIYVMDLDGTNQSRLTTSPAYDDQPKWSPDSSKIVFISNRDGNFEIYTMNADGSGQTRLTNSPAADGFPAWSADGSKIAFVRGDLRDPSTFEIYVMHADGSNQVQLTHDSAIDGVPSWSPDGNKIVFMSGGSSVFDPNSFEIYTMNAADGNNRTRLTNNSIADGQPSYSPDGTKILFASGDAMNPSGIEIYVMNADGSNRVQLTSNSVTDGFPAWSFDGSSIVFASGSVADETSVELFMMNANGTNPVKLTTNSDLDWFPDWQRIATPPSQLQFSSASYAAAESSGSVPVTITRTGNTTGMASVSYATSDTAGASNCNVVGSVASSRCDYETTLGTLNFAPGETSKTISVFLVDDSYAENNEAFTVSLSFAVGSGVGLGSTATTTVTITDNDTTTGANPLDNAGFFVRQHYIDFLNREPDSSGLAFWTNQITSCGSDTACTEIRRINVSAAFFLSIEFQETGYFVYRVYKVGHNIMPAPVRYAEFVADTQQIGQGVVVGVGNWQAQLESNKQAYVLDFVLRLKFIQDRPYSLTPAEFVDALYTNAGVTPSASERTAAVNEFGGAPNTVDTAARARVLRRVAENSTLKTQELNKAFVLMEYFGYLRRNPFDPPEPNLNFDGYNFWLNKLNQFNGNFVNAEMVKAFILSTEYRQRFGP